MESLVRRRLHHQQLAAPPRAAAGEVVRRLGAMQAQNYAGAKWAIGLRMNPAASLVMEKAAALGAAAMRSAVLYAHTSGAYVPDYIGLISSELLLNLWDREILHHGVFQMHPEYQAALAE